MLPANSIRPFAGLNGGIQFWYCEHLHYLVNNFYGPTNCAHCLCREPQNNLATFNFSGSIVAKETKAIVWGFTGNHMVLMSNYRGQKDTKT